MLAQLIIGGLSIGALYALAALGLVLIYKTSDVVNFAQGEMAMITTFVSFSLMMKQGYSYPFAFLLALIFSFVFGATVERLFLRRLQNTPLLSQIIFTLGLYITLRGLAGVIWGVDPVSYPAAIEGKPLHFLGIVIAPQVLLDMLVTLALMLLIFFLFRFTLTGLAMRSVAQNITSAKLMGINVGRIFSLAWALGAVLGGVAGMLIAPVTFLDPNMMGEVVIKAFAAAVIGGFTSLPGAVIGGLVLGIAENLIGGYIAAELKTSLVFLLLIGVLYVRPNGLFGLSQAKKV